MSKGRTAWLQFMDAILRSQPGDTFEIGLTWQPVDGWMIYQRIGQKFLMIPPAQARALSDSYVKVAKRPEWKKAAEEMRDTLDALRPLADECDEKNRTGEKPPLEDDFDAFMSKWGAH